MFGCKHYIDILSTTLSTLPVAPTNETTNFAELSEHDLRLCNNPKIVPERQECKQTRIQKNTKRGISRGLKLSFDLKKSYTRLEFVLCLKDVPRFHRRTTRGQGSSPLLFSSLRTLHRQGLRSNCKLQDCSGREYCTSYRTERRVCSQTSFSILQTVNIRRCLQ